MPVLAVVAAVIAVEVAVTVTTVWTVIAAAGAVIGAVGAVTGNKDLIKIGAVVGIVGGIGSLATGAFSGAEAVSGGLDGPAGDLGGGMMGNVSGGAGAVSGGLDGPAGDIIANPVTPTEAAVSGGLDGVAGDAVTSGASAGAGGAEGSGGLGDTTTAAQDVVGDTYASALPNNTSPTDAASLTDQAYNGSSLEAPIPDGNYNQVKGDIYNETVNGLANGGLNTGGTTASGTSAFDQMMGAFKGVGGYLKENPMIGNALLSGISNAADPSQRNLRDAQANNLNANAAQTRNQITNANSGTSLIDWSQVYPGAGKPRGKTAASGMIAAASKGG
jgi:hypothetical protein